MHNILIIDGDAEFRTGLVKALTAADYQARGAADAAGGLKTMGEEVFQIIILDLRQTIAENRDLLRTIRAYNENAGVIVCALDPTVDDVLGVMKRGVDDFLTRPCPAAAVVAAVGQIVRRRGLNVSSAHQLNLAIGQMIRQTRLGRKMTLKQLANRTGLSVSLISQIELGKTSASISTIHKVSCAMGMKLHSLFASL